MAEPTRRTGDEWSIETHHSLQKVMEDPGCPDLLKETLDGTLTWQGRNETPIERAVLSPRVVPVWSAALLALDAQVTLETEEGGSEQLSYQILLDSRPDGDLARLTVRLQGERSGHARVSRTVADEPIVTATAVVTLSPDDDTVQKARVVLTGVSGDAIHSAQAVSGLVRERLTAERIREVAAQIPNEVDPPTDFRGSAEYRRAMSAVVTRRALDQCLNQEESNG